MLYAIVKIDEYGKDLISIATTEEEAIELRRQTCKEHPNDEVEIKVYDENQYDGYIRDIYCGSIYDYTFPRICPALILLSKNLIVSMGVKIVL